MSTRSLTTVAALAVLLVATWLVWPNPRPLPEARFNLLDGSTLTRADLVGRPALIAFWSVTCEPCLRDMPRLARLQESLADRGLTVIGVAMPQDLPAAVIGLAQAHAPGYAIALDPHGEVNRAFGGVEATPTVFLVDPAGNIRYQAQGPLDEARVRATLLTFSP